MKKMAYMFIAAALVCSAQGGATGHSQDAEKHEREAVVTDVVGTAEVKTDENGEWVGAEKGMKLSEGDMIKTARASKAFLHLEGVSEAADVEIKETSILRLKELFEDRNAKTQTTLLELALGEILIKSQKLREEKSKFEVKTPTSIIGVRGTVFSVSVKRLE